MASADVDVRTKQLGRAVANVTERHQKLLLAMQQDDSLLANQEAVMQAAYVSFVLTLLGETFIGFCRAAGIEGALNA